MPKLFSHIFNSDSKSVTFGWTLSLAAHAFFVLFPERFGVDEWVKAQGAASLLVAGKTAKEAYLEGRAVKAPDAPAAA